MEELAEQQQQRQSLEKTPVPPYEAWPSVPKIPLEVKMQIEKPNVMDLDNVMSPTDRYSRATSVLSMDDFEAAKALEGLRTGKTILTLSSVNQSNSCCRFQTLSSPLSDPPS
jgi:hypothetical protein